MLLLFTEWTTLYVLIGILFVRSIVMCPPADENDDVVFMVLLWPLEVTIMAVCAMGNLIIFLARVGRISTSAPETIPSRFVRK